MVIDVVTAYVVRTVQMLDLLGPHNWDYDGESDDDCNGEEEMVSEPREKVSTSRYRWSGKRKLVVMIF